MCQPKPGPRCSAHARTKLNTKHAAFEAAAGAHETTREADRTYAGGDPGVQARLHSVAQDAQKAYWASSAALREATAEHDATPDGLARLQENLSALYDQDRDEAVTERIEALTERIADATTTRARQVGELAASRTYLSRLETPPAEELAALDQCDAEVADRELSVEEARRMHDEIDTVVTSLRAEEQEALAVARDVAIKVKAVQDMLVEARTDVHDQMARLYHEAGVSARFARFYATDALTSATRVTGQSPATRPVAGSEADLSAIPQRALKVKVKREGADRDHTLAAHAASLEDADFQQANRNWVASGEDMASATADAELIRTTQLEPIHEKVQEALRARSVARYAMEDAAGDLTKSHARRDDLRARIGSGIGLLPTETLPMQHVGDEIVRNPDGSTNAFVYHPASDGFAHGRYVAATGIARVDGDDTANALVLENGDKAWLHGHYARRVRGTGEVQTGYAHVVLVPGDSRAVPLRNEALASAGYYTYVDTSD